MFSHHVKISHFLKGAQTKSCDDIQQVQSYYSYEGRQLLKKAYRSMFVSKCPVTYKFPRLEHFRTHLQLTETLVNTGCKQVLLGRFRGVAVVNPGSPNSDTHLISSNNIPNCSNIQVTTIKEMITKHEMS